MICIRRTHLLRRLYLINSLPSNATFLIPLRNFCDGDTNTVRPLECERIRNFGAYLEQRKRIRATVRKEDEVGLLAENYRTGFFHSLVVQIINFETKRFSIGLTSLFPNSTMKDNFRIHTISKLRRSLKHESSIDEFNDAILLKRLVISWLEDNSAVVKRPKKVSGRIRQTITELYFIYFGHVLTLMMMSEKQGIHVSVIYPLAAVTRGIYIRKDRCMRIFERFMDDDGRIFGDLHWLVSELNSEIYKHILYRLYNNKPFRKSLS